MFGKSHIKVVESDIEGASYGVCDSNSDRAGCAAISVEDLALQYSGVFALENVNLSIRPCEVTALVGPSGCGKTSLLNCFNRLTDLIPGARVSGRINFGRVEVLAKDCDLTSLRRRVGMVFQRPTPFPLSISKNFHIPLKEHGFKCKNIREALLEKALKDVGLWAEVKDRLKRPALELSGGQQQRLCIARTLALNPEVILMDEPCSSLDPIAASRIEDLIASLRGDYTIVIVTHNLPQAKRVSDNTIVFWLKEGVGQVIEQGATDDIFEQPHNSLTKDYINGLRG